MTKFKDAKGREWSLDLTVGMVERVKADADTDLDEILERPDAIGSTLMKSPRRVAQILWAMIADQAATVGVDARDFGFALDRPALDRAADALIEEMVLFYPRSSAGRAIAGRLPEMLARMDREIAAAVEAELSGTATASPVSAGSIPAG